MDQFWQSYYWVQFGLSILSLVGAVYTLAMLVLNHWQIKRLLEVAIPSHVENWPKISLIAPARNEERNIEAAMNSLLSIDYPNLQITIVNDRSTDRSGEILKRIAAADARLNVVDIADLPPSWLGKNHAMHVGALRSDGQWLLFTDADIVFEPTTLRRAIVYAQTQRLDHLAALPDVRMPNWFLDSFIIAFSTAFTVFIRPSHVRDPNSSAYIGIGAFNLVRAEAYRASGGHVAIRMRPDDDLKLGHLLKLNHFRSDVVNGHGAILVEWYATLNELICGLEKNSPAPLEYDVRNILGACLLMFLINIWPFVAIFTVDSWPRIFFAIACGLLLLGNVLTAITIRHSLLGALMYPLAMLIFLYIQLRALALLFIRGGIRWRGTFYSLAELRENRI